MNNMELILSLDNYTIYKSNNYYICIPKSKSIHYHIFISFSMKNLNTLPQNELIKEIRKVSDSINYTYKNGIYILPIVDPKILKEATIENDDRLYNKILNNIILPITNEVYQILTKQNIKINQTINMIKQNDIDKKLIGWISLKLGNNFIKEITFDNKQKTNPKDIYMDTITHSSSLIFVNNFETNKTNLNIDNSLKPAFSSGFSNITFIILVLSIFSVFGIIIAYMIIK